MGNLLNSIKVKKPYRSVFDLSQEFQFTGNMGALIPVYCRNTVPGDKFRLSWETLIRFLPMVAPVMHRMKMYMHYWYVPFRILWPEWTEFYTNRESVPPVWPYLPFKGTDDVTVGSLADYMGLPLSGTNNDNISAMWFAAYQCIFDNFYRDEDLTTQPLWQLVPGDNSGNFNDLTRLQFRSWAHDYFTSSAPWSQKGSQVGIPIDFNQVDIYKNESGGGNTTITSAPNNTLVANVVNGDVPAEHLWGDVSGTGTINDLRRAEKLQQWLELNARAGTRIKEMGIAHFGVDAGDDRLQLPEYICGGVSPVQVSEVLQTSESGSTPQGNMSGHGIGIAQKRGKDYFCKEHGVIIGIMSIMPDTSYGQGIEKALMPFASPLDLPWPLFANLGEQPVLNREIMGFLPTPDADGVFGYLPRYAEYKTAINRVAGLFRPGKSLDFYTLSRQFTNGSVVPLNENFVQTNLTDFTRIFADTNPDDHKLMIHHLNHVTAVRPFPKFGTPSNI